MGCLVPMVLYLAILDGMVGRGKNDEYYSLLLQLFIIHFIICISSLMSQKQEIFDIYHLLCSGGPLQYKWMEQYCPRVQIEDG